MGLQLFISALILGAVSSFHCVGMCGVFAFSIPTQHMSNTKKVFAILLYNFGRITTYTVFGLLFGLLGKQISLTGFQQLFSIIAGIIILIIVTQGLLKRTVFSLPGYAKISSLISKLIYKFLGSPSLTNIYMLGITNGLLPCGLVYLAITGALATGTVTGATAFMAAYGLGTMPAMFILSYFHFMISLSARNFIKRSVPYMVGVMGILLILRGTNLSIPYISPAFSASHHAISCGVGKF